MRVVRWARAVRWYVRELAEVLNRSHREECRQGRCC